MTFPCHLCLAPEPPHTAACRYGVVRATILRLAADGVSGHTLRGMFPRGALARELEALESEGLIQWRPGGAFGSKMWFTRGWRTAGLISRRPEESPVMLPGLLRSAGGGR